MFVKGIGSYDTLIFHNTSKGDKTLVVDWTVDNAMTPLTV